MKNKASVNQAPTLLLSDAAFLAGIRPERLRRWWAREPWSVIGPTDATKLSFDQLIEILYVVKLRDKKVSLKHICKAHDLYRDRYKSPTPFAEQGVLLSLKRIVIPGHELSYIDTETKQIVAEFTNEILEHIQFKDNKATSYTFKEGNTNIVISPHILGCMPVIGGTRLETNFIVSQVVANDYNVPLVAEIYEISEDVVKDAINFELEHAV